MASSNPCLNPSRRSVVAALLGGLAARAETNHPVRLAISETMVADVNMNDARAAMLIWIRQMMKDLGVTIDLNPNVFDTTEEIIGRARAGRLDAVALNILEYRQIADVLDPTQIVAAAGKAGLEQYVLLARRDSGFQQLGNLRGKRLSILKGPKMCVAGAWIANILDEGHFGASERFFGAMGADPKVARVVLPVFFGQADACVTTRASFETMCELNPQVGKNLEALAASPPLMVTFYVFHKDFHNANRDRFVRVFSELRSSAAGRQLATLFQFDELAIRDASCLASALNVLEAADRARNRSVQKDKG